jgi:hypothetical protein
MAQKFIKMPPPCGFGGAAGSLRGRRGAEGLSPALYEALAGPRRLFISNNVAVPPAHTTCSVAAAYLTATSTILTTTRMKATSR